jgi:hypothetical protein
VTVTRTFDGVRIAWLLVALLAVAGSAASNPPPYAMPPQAQPAGSTAATAYGPCEYACGQLSRCQLAPYDACVGECRRTGTEQQTDGRERLDAVARTSCDQLAAASDQTASTPSAPPSAPPEPSNGGAGNAPAGRRGSASSVSYTNAAMTSADIYLEVAIAGDGAFHGSWARYICLVQMYGIWSCGKGDVEGRASGRLEADGTGSIELERLGRSTLVWSPKSAGEITLDLPRDWQGGVLFRSTMKR